MSLITEHDKFHFHKILGFGSLIHYFYRFILKLVYGSMFIENGYYPLFHLLLSLSSFIFKVPVQRFINKTIIWKELQLHNIIFTSRSVFMIYHCRNLDPNNYLFYYISRFIIILSHHLIADIITNKYQNNNLTTTRDIIYQSDNKILIKLNKYFYSISQLIATTILLLSQNEENGLIILFPIQLSAFLMTLVRKQLITNNQWHYIYTMSLLLPYILNINVVNNNRYYIDYIILLHLFLRLVLKINKYVNLIIISMIFIQLNYYKYI